MAFEPSLIYLLGLGFVRFGLVYIGLIPLFSFFNHSHFGLVLILEMGQLYYLPLLTFRLELRCPPHGRAYEDQA